MKFKAVFSDLGLQKLEKGFVPTLEKFGKTCQVLLGPEDIHFIQTSVNTDGVHIVARLAQEVLFEEGSYLIKSRCQDKIAFSFEVGNLLRVLRGSSMNEAQLLEIKLAMRTVAVAGSSTPASKPFLTFTCRGESVNIVSDMPISQPYKAQEIERLSEELESVQLANFYLDIQPDVARLQAVVDKLKSLGDNVLLAITKGGDMHIQVQHSHVELGMELRNLVVLPADEASNAQQLQGESADARLQEILSEEDACAVQVQLRHFARSLQVSQLTQPQQLLCGIPDSNGHVHFMFVYKDPFSDSAYDDKISLSYRLPVRDDM